MRATGSAYSGAGKKTFVAVRANAGAREVVNPEGRGLGQYLHLVSNQVGTWMTRLDAQVGRVVMRWKAVQ